MYNYNKIYKDINFIKNKNLKFKNKITNLQKQLNKQDIIIKKNINKDIKKQIQNKLLNPKKYFNDLKKNILISKKNKKFIGGTQIKNIYNTENITNNKFNSYFNKIEHFLNKQHIKKQNINSNNYNNSNNYLYIILIILIILLFISIFIKYYY